MRYEPHMHSGVRTIQRVSQNKLKGRPRTMGWMRSQRGTVKHIAMNGIRARSSEVRLGFFAVGGIQ
jgi:hypothetical protein